MRVFLSKHRNTVLFQFELLFYIVYFIKCKDYVKFDATVFRHVSLLLNNKCATHLVHPMCLNVSLHDVLRYTSLVGRRTF
jgi:hypothetical protein